MTPLKIHPLALAFPEVDDADFQALKADIKAHGLREPIITLDGQVLDGRTRYQACCELGIQAPSFKYEGTDPVQFVKSANLFRRHLSASQRAAAIVACSEWMEAHRPEAPVKRVALRPVSSPNATPELKVAAAATLSESTAEVEDVSFREAPKSNVEMAREAKVSVRTITDAKAAHKAGLSDAIRDGALTAEEAATVARGEPAKPRKTKPAPEPAPQAAPAPAVDEGELEELREKIDFLSEENTQLTDRLAVHFMEGTADEKAAAADLIGSLRAELATAHAELDAVKASRDGLLTSNAEKEKQIGSMRRKLDKIDKEAKAAA